jgi:hypothetical protein
MTIRYTSGTYATPQALLDAIDTHVVTVLGWTRNMGPTLVAGKSGKRAHYQKTITKDGVARTVYWNLLAPGAAEVQGTSSSETSQFGIYSYPSTGYDVGLAWDRQPGYPIASSGGLGLFPASTIELAPSTAQPYVISGNIYGDVYIVFKTSTGLNLSLSAGVLDKTSCGAYEGGEFAGAASIAGNSYWSQYNFQETPFGAYNANFGAGFLVRCTVDGITDWVTVMNRFATTGDTTYTTQLRGIGNVGSPYTNPTLYPAPSIPNVSYRSPAISYVNGVITHRQLQCAVMRTSTRFSVLGDVPLVTWAPIVFMNGITWGTVVNNRKYTNLLAMELRDE